MTNPKLEEYCRPRKNIPFERYCFNRRQQEAGETYEQYRTALRKLSQTCEFQSITPDELLRDRLVFGIRDDKLVRGSYQGAEMPTPSSATVARSCSIPE